MKETYYHVNHRPRGVPPASQPATPPVTPVAEPGWRPQQAVTARCEARSARPGRTLAYPGPQPTAGHPPARPPRHRRRRRPLVVVLAILLVAAVALGIIFSLPGGPKAKPMAGPPYLIALDPGHGGDDVGAEGLEQEVAVTERTVAHLYQLLEADELFTPMLCRNYGEGKTPRQRALTAKKAGASLLLSVHGNSHSDASTTGFECFPVPPGRQWHDESLTLANYLAQEMAAAGGRLRGEGGVRYIYYENDEKVIREVSDTGVYQSESFGVLEYPECMAVLAEQCFLTSPEDYAAFGSEEGSRRTAECYYRAIKRFFGEL